MKMRSVTNSVTRISIVKRKFKNKIIFYLRERYINPPYNVVSSISLQTSDYNEAMAKTATIINPPEAFMDFYDNQKVIFNQCIIQEDKEGKE